MGVVRRRLGRAIRGRGTAGRLALNPFAFGGVDTKRCEAAHPARSRRKPRRHPTYSFGNFHGGPIFRHRSTRRPRDRRRSVRSPGRTGSRGPVLAIGCPGGLARSLCGGSPRCRWAACGFECTRAIRFHGRGESGTDFSGSLASFIRSPSRHDLVGTVIRVQGSVEAVEVDSHAALHVEPVRVDPATSSR